MAAWGGSLRLLSRRLCISTPLVVTSELSSAWLVVIAYAIARGDGGCRTARNVVARGDGGCRTALNVVHSIQTTSDY